VGDRAQLHSYQNSLFYSWKLGPTQQDETWAEFSTQQDKTSTEFLALGVGVLFSAMLLHSYQKQPNLKQLLGFFPYVKLLNSMGTLFP
jgi:hypothetical protein